MLVCILSTEASFKMLNILEIMFLISLYTKNNVGFFFQLAQMVSLAKNVTRFARTQPMKGTVTSFVIVERNLVMQQLVVCKVNNVLGHL